jgi:hypothetical protein
MSINDSNATDWDDVTSRFYDNRPFPKDVKPDCLLVKPDPVNKPDHYRVGEVEAIAYIEQQLGSGVRDYLLGNLHKYLHRHRFKGNALEDLKKAQWYLNKLIMEEEQGG